ncbi:MAG TPA: Ig-like domain-containing protein [Dehalococcoidia bacterium]|nr:Ig-like domain-containing protein [Dehalococcoidia bacterium]
MFTRLSIAGIAAALLLVVAAHANSASAQYPPPSGNCAITIAAAQAAPGGSAPVTVTVRDVNGNPVPNSPVSVTITSQPGTDASLAMNGAATDANGVVTGTLHVGTTAGSVKIGATPSGNACSAEVVVGQGQVAAQVNLPNTGTGPGANGAPSVLIALLVAAGSAVAVAGLGVRRMSRG